jgi:hypothetical protein
MAETAAPRLARLSRAGRFSIQESRIGRHERFHPGPEALEPLQHPARRRLSYGDYVEQLTFLLFLKMAHEKTGKPFFQKPIIDAPWNWPTLLELDADDLEVHYRHTLEALGKADG